MVMRLIIDYYKIIVLENDTKLIYSSPFHPHNSRIGRKTIENIRFNFKSCPYIDPQNIGVTRYFEAILNKKIC